MAQDERRAGTVGSRRPAIAVVVLHPADGGSAGVKEHQFVAAVVEAAKKMSDG